MKIVAHIRGIIEVAFAQLIHDRTRSALVVLGIALAVLSTTLLASVGFGVIETGQEKFDAADRDLWVTGGPIEIQPGTVGGFESSLVGAHTVAANISAREDVKTAVPMAFQTVYVSTNQSAFVTQIGTGAPARGSSVNIVQGRGFDERDIHYADGTYSGPMTHEVVIDERTAERFDIGVNDTLYIGGTVATAREHKYRVVGISPTFSRFLGTPTVTVHLSELQELTGTTGSDRATFISVSLADGADPQAVEQELERSYPGYNVRTNREQLEATLQRQAVVIASGASLVGLAVIAGLALTVNLLLSLVYQQRETFAAMKALGTSSTTLIGIVFLQAVLLGVLGGALGIALTGPSVDLLNFVAQTLVGFEGLVRTPSWILSVGFAIAVLMSVFGAMAAGWRIASLEPLEQLP